MKTKPLYRISRCSLFAAIICVCSFLNFPVGPVPVTAALLAVMLVGIVLSPLEALLTTTVYILIGALGIPVFSSGGAGIGILLGPTGGYIWSYPFLALITSLFSLIKTNKKPLKYLFAFIGCITGTAVCYFCGTLQYMYICSTTFYTAVLTCIIPFIIFDIIKAIAACSVGVLLRNRI